MDYSIINACTFVQEDASILIIPRHIKMLRTCGVHWSDKGIAKAGLHIIFVKKQIPHMFGTS